MVFHITHILVWGLLMQWILFHNLLFSYVVLFGDLNWNIHSLFYFFVFMFFSILECMGSYWCNLLISSWSYIFMATYFIWFTVTPDPFCSIAMGVILQTWNVQSFSLLQDLMCHTDLYIWTLRCYLLDFFLFLWYAQMSPGSC